MATPTSGSSGTSSRTYASTATTAQTTVTPSIITRSDEVALYFSQDLEQLVAITGIDLADAFQIPLEYSQDPQDVITLLHEDIAHMLRDGLITGMHLIISDSEMDKGTNEYLVRYHVHYKVDNLNTFVQAPGDIRGLTINPPKGVWRDARFALLIDWSPSAKDRRYYVRRPDYCFDWVTEETRFDSTNVICYSQGQMVADSAELVSRAEHTSLEHHENIW